MGGGGVCGYASMLICVIVSKRLSGCKVIHQAVLEDSCVGSLSGRIGSDAPRNGEDEREAHAAQRVVDDQTLI